jgi:hypothetical protein
MKTFKLLVFGMMLMLASSAQSQLSVNVHIGTPPAWGPSGYNDVRYYYLPDVEAYYDVQTSMFIYISGNRWIHRSYLPTRYRNYDLYHGYKVVMNDYRGNSPYSHFRQHKMKYAKGYRGAEQRNNGERNNQYNDNRDRQQNNRPNRNVERRDERNQVRNMNQERGNNNGNGHGNNKNENHGNEKNNDHDNGNGKGNGNRK